MRINDFHNILELVKQDILQSDAEYLKLLRVVGNNQRYDFRSQLSIYDKNLEATACAKFDYWRERFHRLPMMRLRRKIFLTCSGVASVATSKSLGSTPNSKSLTAPPTM